MQDPSIVPVQGGPGRTWTWPHPTGVSCALQGHMLSDVYCPGMKVFRGRGEAQLVAVSCTGRQCRFQLRASWWGLQNSRTGNSKQGKEPREVSEAGKSRW